MSNHTALPPFTVTPAAVRQLETVGGTVRVDLAPTGCCGLTYTWTTDPPATDDEVFGCTGAALAVSAAAAQALTGAHVDDGARLHPPRFRHERPCGACPRPETDRFDTRRGDVRRFSGTPTGLVP